MNIKFRIILSIDENIKKYRGVLASPKARINPESKLNKIIGVLESPSTSANL